MKSTFTLGVIASVAGASMIPCCKPGLLAHCDNHEVMNCVGKFDEFCKLIHWDNQCVEQAKSVCELECEGIGYDWREIMDDNAYLYPAGEMLEIALRRLKPGVEKLEMFKWRSEFLAQLATHPGSNIEREFHSLYDLGVPANYGEGTWTGMSTWRRQQDWHDFANNVFGTAGVQNPSTANWLATIDMTLIFVKAVDPNWSLKTFGQSAGEIAELGILAFPDADVKNVHEKEKAYLAALEKHGINTYTFEVYANPYMKLAPFTTAYNNNYGGDEGESWSVYVASYPDEDKRAEVQAAVTNEMAALQGAVTIPHSDFQWMTKTVSYVCCKTGGKCSLDPDYCAVNVMGYGDKYANACSECPRACCTGFNTCSLINPVTCVNVGGQVADKCDECTNDKQMPCLLVDDEKKFCGPSLLFNSDE